MANERKPRQADGVGEKKGTANKPAARPRHNRRGLLDLDSEQTARVIIFAAVGLVVAIAAGFVIFGYWFSVVRPRHRTVLQVADQKVSYSAMKRRMSYEYLQNSTYQTAQGFQLLPEAAFQALLNELTQITQAGPKLGITIDPGEVDQRLRGKIAVAANADQRQFADGLRKALDRTGLNEGEFRSITLAEAFKTKILEKFKAEAPASDLQAKVAIISARTEAEAKLAIDRINAGEDFGVVAKELSQDPDVQTTGGIKDYLPKEALDASFRDVAFSAEIGSLSPPIASFALSGASAGAPVYYVVKVIDRADQPISDGQRAQIAEQKLPDWLKATQDELRTNGKIKRDWEERAQAAAWIAIAGRATAKLAALQKQLEDDQQRQQSAQTTAIAQLTASPQAASTPSPDSTPPAISSEEGAGASPVVPAQPVAPGSNGP